GHPSFAPSKAEEQQGKPGIVEAARRYLMACHNDLENLFLEDAGANRRIKQAYDSEWARNEAEARRQRQKYVDKWAFENQEFTITLTIETNEVEGEVTVLKPGARRR